MKRNLIIKLKMLSVCLLTMILLIQMTGQIFGQEISMPEAAPIDLQILPLNAEITDLHELLLEADETIVFDLMVRNVSSGIAEIFYSVAENGYEEKFHLQINDITELETKEEELDYENHADAREESLQQWEIYEISDNQMLCLSKMINVDASAGSSLNISLAFIDNDGNYYQTEENYRILRQYNVMDTFETETESSLETESEEETKTSEEIEISEDSSTEPEKMETSENESLDLETAEVVEETEILEDETEVTGETEISEETEASDKTVIEETETSDGTEILEEETESSEESESLENVTMDSEKTEISEGKEISKETKNTNENVTTEISKMEETTNVQHDLEYEKAIADRYENWYAQYANVNTNHYAGGSEETETVKLLQEESVSQETEEQENEKEKTSEKNEQKTTEKTENTEGSFYDLSALEAINGEFLQHTGNLTILETNADKLKEDTIKITVSRNGETFELEKGTDYQLKLIGNSKKQKIYKYTINEEVFADDGMYRVYLHSEDEAGNVNENERKDAGIWFSVDNTSPLIISCPSTADANDKLSREIRIRDNIQLAEVEIYVDEQKVDYVADGESYRFSLPNEDEENPEIRVVARDQAGNEYERHLTNYVTAGSATLKKQTNIWKAAICIFLGTAAVLITATIHHKKSKSKKQTALLKTRH